MKVYVHKPNEDWIVDVLSNEFSNHTSLDIAPSYNSADLIWLISNWTWTGIPPEALSSLPVICTIHHILPESLHDPKYTNNFNLRDRFVDRYHVTNNKTLEYIKQITNKPVVKIPFWVDTSFWKTVDKKECREEFGIRDEEFVIGSFQRDTEGSDLRSPKLSKGPDLLCDFVERVNEKNPHLNITMLLAGYRRQYVKGRMDKAKIRVRSHEKIGRAFLNLLYQCCDMYIVSSRCEGGPHAIFECASNRTPIISTDVGIAREMLSRKCIVDIENLEQLVVPRKADISLAHVRAKEFDINKMIPKYDTMLKGLVD